MANVPFIKVNIEIILDSVADHLFNTINTEIILDIVAYFLLVVEGLEVEGGTM